MVILHLDDNKNWIDAVAKQLPQMLAGANVLSRRYVQEASSVVENEKLDAVVLDLMVEGGNEVDARKWLDSIAQIGDEVSVVDLIASSPDKLVSKLPAKVLERIPASKVGREAARKGAKVVILTNVAKFLPEDKLDTETERKLIMAACGATDYVLKTDDDWCSKVIRAI
jgi:CheY-like chemotaxis protein